MRRRAAEAVVGLLGAGRRSRTSLAALLRCRIAVEAERRCSAQSKTPKPISKLMSMERHVEACPVSSVLSCQDAYRHRAVV